MHGMHTTVAILGAGLAGLYAGRLLDAAGVDFRVIEARERLGGRILTTDERGVPSADGFDLGPSWFWPHVQPQLAALVQELGLAFFPQHTEGDVIFQRMSRETPLRYRATDQEPQSMRIAGGSAALVAALAKPWPRERVLLGTRATQMALSDTHVRLTTTQADGSQSTVVAEQVIAAMPPRLLAQLDFSPPVDAATARLWRNTATWMAPHAKFFAVYDRPFWREAGLAGTAQSFVGPLGEIHDATTASGTPALFGFFAVGADLRASLGEAALTQSCLQQLARLFGAEALQPRATIVKDWAADALTATADDRTPTGHPQPSAAPWADRLWQQRLALGGSETGAADPGVMAGALSAAERAVKDVLGRLKSAPRD